MVAAGKAREVRPMESSAARKLGISNQDIEMLLSQREAEKRLKHLLERVQESLREIEDDLVARLDRGADVSGCTYALRIRESARRFPAWKEHFINLAGKDAADQVLEQTEPKMFRNLVVEIA